MRTVISPCFAAFFTKKNNFHGSLFASLEDEIGVVVVALLFYVHGKQLRSCRDGQLT